MALKFCGFCSSYPARRETEAVYPRFFKVGKQMGRGILEDRYLENVPGTSLFNDDPNAAALSAFEGYDLSRLKHGSGKNKHIVLVPQPSDDPNDPLNWPKWKKHMARKYFNSSCAQILLI